MKVSKQATTRYALTGTPCPNYAYQIYPILHYLFPDLFTSYWNFLYYYFDVQEQIINRNLDTVKKVGGFQSTEKQQELQEFIELFSIQRKRSEVMKWLPPSTEEVIFLPMEYDQADAHNQLKTYFEYGEVVLTGVLDQIIKLRQAAIDPNLVEENNTSSNKTKFILQYLEDYPDEQVVIVSDFTSYLKKLKPLIKKSVCLIGETSMKKRKEIETDFNSGKYRVILGNIEVIKEGITLEAASTIIFINEGLVYGDNIQCKDRILATTPEKAKQKVKQHIITLVSEHSIEEYFHEQLKLKKSSSEMVNNYIKYLKTT
jgi:superfamily II DNA or RNA helicase